MVGSRITRRTFLRTGAVGLTTAAAGCFGPEQDGIYAMARNDGSERWVNTLGSIDGGPVVGDDTIFVGSGQTVHAISTADGDQHWSYDVEFEYTNDIKDPWLWNGTVLVPAGKELYALSTADGSEEWTFGTDNAVRGHSAVHGGRVFAGTTGKRVHALSTESGSEHWRWDQPPGSPITPLFTTWPATMGLGQTAYVAHAGRLFALNARDGSEEWRAKTDLTSMGLQRSGETIYVSGDGLTQGGVNDDSSASSYGAVEAYDRRDGRERWSKTLTGDEIEGRPVVAENAVYAGTDAGVVHAIDERDGSEAWTAETGADILHGPVIDGETVYVGTER